MTILRLCIFNHWVIKTEMAKKTPANKDRARKDGGGKWSRMSLVSVKCNSKTTRAGLEIWKAMKDIDLASGLIL